MKKGLFVLVAILAVIAFISTGCSKKTSKLEKDLEQAKAEKQQAISEKASLEFVLAQTQDSLIETEKQLKTFTELLEKNNTENAATVKKLTDDLTSANNNLASLQTNLDKATENIKLLKEDNEQLTNAKSNATESLNNLKKQNQDLQNQIQELKKPLEL